MKKPDLSIVFSDKTKAFWGKDTTGYSTQILLNAILGRPLYLNIRTQQIRAGLLESAITTNNGQTWQLKLRPGQKFHNGRDVSIEDFEFAFGHILSCRFGTPDQRTLTAIQGANQIPINQFYRTGSIQGLKILNSSLLQVNLQYPDEFWIDAIAKCILAPIPCEEQNLAGSLLDSHSRSSGSHFSWKNHPVGAGPYRIVDGDEKEVWLEKFSDCLIPEIFSANSPRLIRLTCRPQESYKNFDLAFGIQKSKLELDWKKLKLFSTDLTECLMGLYFNFDSPIVRDERFRKAVSLSVNRKEISNAASAKPTFTMIPRHFYKETYHFTEPDFQPHQAKRLFEKLMSEYKINEFIVYDAASEISSWKKKVIEQLNQAGLPIRIQTDPTAFATATHPDFMPFLMLGYIPSFSRVLPVFKGFQEGIGWVSQLNERDESYNLLLEKALQEGVHKQDFFVQKLQERFLEKNYAIPLFETNLEFFTNSEKIKTIHPEKQDLSPRIDLVELVS